MNANTRDVRNLVAYQQLSLIKAYECAACSFISRRSSYTQFNSRLLSTFKDWPIMLIFQLLLCCSAQKSCSQLCSLYFNDTTWLLIILCLSDNSSLQQLQAETVKGSSCN